jgi:hypothetical protein
MIREIIIELLQDIDCELQIRPQRLEFAPGHIIALIVSDHTKIVDIDVWRIQNSEIQVTHIKEAPGGGAHAVNKNWNLGHPTHWEEFQDYIKEHVEGKLVRVEYEENDMPRMWRC